MACNVPVQTPADLHSKHTLRKVMHCMCGETFTRRIDLTGHVELVHARGKQVNPSTGANANGETLPRGHQISQSLPAGQGVEESGTQFRCTDFASCNRVFENRHDLVAHVRYVFPRSSKTPAVLISFLGHIDLGLRDGPGRPSRTVLRPIPKGSVEFPEDLPITRLQR